MAAEIVQLDDPGGASGLERLLRRARREGEPDVVRGKRRCVRYNVGMRLEMKPADAEDSDATPVSIHNISGGGIGFWSQREFAVGADVLVRDPEAEMDGEWHAATVVHSSLGIRGYLVGAAFARPRGSDSDTDTPCVEEESNEASRFEPFPHTPLRRRCAYACGLASVLGTATAALTWFATDADSGYLWLSCVAGLAVAIVVGLSSASLITSHDTSFCRDLRVELQRLARGELDSTPLRDAPSQELIELRRAVLDLRNNWRRREEGQRAHRQKLEDLNLVKSNILSIVSHDLRTPLTSILLYSQMLSEEIDTLDRKDQGRFLEIITAECTRLSRLVDDLLEAQRLQARRVRWQMKPVDLSATIRNCTNVFRVMAESKSIKLSCETPESSAVIEADADKISQVVSNLLANAVKYTPPGGKVHVSATERGNELEMCVTDTGPGIPRDQWDQIFDRFAQYSATQHIRELPGVGLGLYIVRQIVDRHGGRVWVDSEVGRGSSFYVSLPRQLSRIEEEAPEQEDSTSIGRIVVCDADPELASRVAQILRAAEYDVRLAYSGCRLLALLERGRHDVVLTDILLPDVNANDLLNSLNDMTGRSFRLVVHSHAGDGDDLRRRGADVFLKRPATREELLQAVRVAMQKNARGAQTSMIVKSRARSLSLLKRALSDAGQVPLLVNDLPEAARVLRDYQVDAVLVFDEALGNDWEELCGLTLIDTPARIYVICRRIRRKERRLAQRHAVRVLECVSGAGDELVAAVSSPDAAGTTEYEA